MALVQLAFDLDLHDGSVAAEFLPVEAGLLHSERVPAAMIRSDCWMMMLELRWPQVLGRPR